jgi:two-component system sensor histidine kinase BarA
MSYRGWLSIIWLIIFSANSYAHTTVQLIDSDTVERLSKHFKVYFEKDQQLSLNQIIDFQDQFVWQAQENPNYGFSDTGLWLHTSFSNVTDTKDWVIDLGYTQLDKVDFYLVSNRQVIASSKQGKSRLGQDYRFPTIKVQLPYAQKVDLYVRIQSATSSLIAPIDIQSSQKHTRINFIDNLLWGLFYGGLLILALYNFVLYFGNKEKSLLAYVGYIYCHALAVCVGRAFSLTVFDWAHKLAFQSYGSHFRYHRDWLRDLYLHISRCSRYSA